MKVLIVCCRHYNKSELWGALKTLSDQDIPFEVVSTQTVIVSEDGTESYNILRTISQVTTDESFDGILLVSGETKDTMGLWTHPHLKTLLIHFNSENKPIGAICRITAALAPVIKDREVSCYPIIAVKKILTQAGGILTNKVLTVSGNIISAEHEMIAPTWAEEFCNMLMGRPLQHSFTASGFKGKVTPRKLHPMLAHLKGDTKNAS